MTGLFGRPLWRRGRPKRFAAPSTGLDAAALGSGFEAVVKLICWIVVVFSVAIITILVLVKHGEQYPSVASYNTQGGRLYYSCPREARRVLGFRVGYTVLFHEMGYTTRNSEIMFCSTNSFIKHDSSSITYEHTLFLKRKIYCPNF